jgi:hypothetical protein
MASMTTLSITTILVLTSLGTNGDNAWDNVNATVDVSEGRSITINLADEDTQRNFMGQQIYGIVKGLRM